MSALFFSGFALFTGLEAGFGDMLGGLLFRSSFNSLLLNMVIILTPMFLIGFYFTKMIYSRPYDGKWVSFHYIFGFLVLSDGLIFPKHMPMMMNYILLLSIASTFITSFAAIYEAVKKNHFFVLCAPWVVVAAIGHRFIYILDILHLRQTPINWSSILFVMLVIVFTCYALLEYFFLHEETIKENDMSSMKVQLYEEQHRLFPHLNAKWHQTMDSIHQQTQIIKEMLDEQQLTAAFEGLPTIKQYIDIHKTSRMSDSPTLLTILLTTYDSKAENKSITFDYQIDSTLFEPMKEDDVLPLFVHLLDYAFRHTYLLSDPKKLHVFLRAYEKKQHLSIECTFSENINSQTAGHSAQLVYKQKHQDLQAINRILSIYQGDCSFTHDLGTQIIRVRLKL